MGLNDGWIFINADIRAKTPFFSPLAATRSVFKRFVRCFVLIPGFQPNLISLFKLYANAISPKSAPAVGIPFLVMMWSKPHCLFMVPKGCSTKACLFL